MDEYNPIIVGQYADISQKFAVLPKISTSFDIADQLREIPTKFHRD